MRRARVLDLFCGAGGCSVGYARAGFDVVGVDLAPHPRYPFMEIHQGDALAWLSDADTLRTFDLIHASPPCQAYSVTRARWGREHPDLVPQVLDLLNAAGVPWVVENVPGAPLPGATVLCGSMFGLGSGDAVLRRHRLFLTSWTLPPPPQDSCRGRAVVGVYGTGGGWTRTAPGGGGVKVHGPDAAAAMGVDWTTHQGVLSQMIPPAYTQWVGAAFLAAHGGGA